MKRAILLLLALGLCCAIAAQNAEAAITAQTQNLQIAAGIQKLGMITRNQLLRQINKSITMEGFYYDGSIPMVLDNIERVKLDMMLPPDSYVPIVGPVPTGLRSGDRISVQGTIQRPTTQDPRTVQRESLIIKITSAQKITTLRAATTPLIARPSYLERITVGTVVVVPRQVKYAVLIAGGGSPANNHHRYWNDLKAMYNILKASGYNAANIYVIYADGVGRDASMPVNYSATRANISTVFNQLAAKMSSLDTLYIMMNDHGGGVMTVATGGYPPGNYSGAIDTNGDEVGESYSEAAMNKDLNGDGDKSDTVKIDETLCLWYEDITDDQFAAELNKIQNVAKITIQMKQCFCGGFTADLTKPNRIIMASASPTQPSWAHSSLNFGEFTYWYFAALTGNKPDGSGSVNADANGNGKISILEAYNFSRSHDTRPETPYYEDNGVKPSHTGAMPAGGEGTLGAATSL